MSIPYRCYCEDVGPLKCPVHGQEEPEPEVESKVIDLMAEIRRALQAEKARIRRPAPAGEEKP